MILCCGEALIDMLPCESASGERAFAPRPGGAGFNTAVALGRLGMSPGFFSGLSSDPFGQMLESSLAAANVDIGLCVRSARPTTLAFARLTDGQASYTFHDENTAGRMIEEADIPALPANVGAMLFGGISLVAEPCGSAYEELLRRGRERCVTMLDPNIREAFIPDRDRHLRRMGRMLAMADIIKVSEDDLRWFAEGVSPEDVARSWLDEGPKLVVVTRGAEGAVAHTTGFRVAVPARRVEVVDTIGAGDAFNAGVLAALETAGLLSKPSLASLSEAEIAGVMDFAGTVAAATVSRAGADPPWRGELGRSVAKSGLDR